jgi:hypothetical protein
MNIGIATAKQRGIMDTHTLPVTIHAADYPAASFGYLLSAYFLPRGLFLDPEAHGSWDRWSLRRHNLGVLRRYGLVFSRRWAGSWVLSLGLGTLVGGFAGSMIALIGGLAILPAVFFACTKIAADIAGDDLPL